METKLCMFDLDGTLLNTVDDIANSMNHILNANGYPTHNVAWYKEKVGNGAKNLLLNSLPPQHGLNEENINELLKVYREYYQLHSMDLTNPYDGIPELLHYLSELSIQIAVVTNKPQESTNFMLKKYFGDIDFIAIYGEKPNRPIKPDPLVANEILLLTETLPEQTIYIGDSEVDMIFAKSASIFSIGVLWGFRDFDTLKKYDAKAIVEKPRQIINYLK